MSREKPIDIEKHIAITEIKNTLCTMPCDICSMYGKDCINEHIARRLANAGFRKASDVALKVIDEIERATNNHIKCISKLDPQNSYCAGGKKALDMTLKVLAELKKMNTQIEELKAENDSLKASVESLKNK